MASQAVAPHVSRDAALDWLCVNLAPGQLPRSFATGAQGEVAAAPARGARRRYRAGAGSGGSQACSLRPVVMLLCCYRAVDDISHLRGSRGETRSIPWEV
jgi:hypothetical protein